MSLFWIRNVLWAFLEQPDELDELEDALGIASRHAVGCLEIQAPVANPALHQLRLDMAIEAEDEETAVNSANRLAKSIAATACAIAGGSPRSIGVSRSFMAEFPSALSARVGFLHQRDLARNRR